MATGLFLAVAGTMTLAVAKGVSTASQNRVQRQVADAAADQLVALAALPYADLAANTFTPPNRCATDTALVGTAARSCVTVGAVEHQVTYSMTRGAASAELGASASYLDVTAKVILMTGGAAPTNISVTRRVNGPAVAYDVGRSTVRVTLGGAYADIARTIPASGTTPASINAAARPLYVLNAADTSQILGSGYADATGHAYISVPDGSCVESSPCLLGLSSGNRPLEVGPFGLTLSTAQPARTSVPVGGANAGQSFPSLGSIVLPPGGGQADAFATVFRKSRAVLQLVGRNASSGTALNSVAGSICLWATFHDGRSDRSVPLCNTTSAGSVMLDSYAPDPARAPDPADPARPYVLAPMPVGTPITFTTDSPDRTCPRLPGMVGHNNNAWRDAAVCTSWTWGQPRQLIYPSASGQTAVTFEGATYSLPTDGTAAMLQAVWTHLNADGSADTTNANRAVAGIDGNGALWAKPRDFASLGAGSGAAGSSCALDGSCVSFGGKVHELEECTSGFCQSTANAAPFVTTPNGHGTFAVSGGGAATDVTVRFIDNDGSNVNWYVSRTTTRGTLTLSPTGALPTATSKLTQASGSTRTLRYTSSSTDTNLDFFTVVVDDGTLSDSYDIALYQTNQQWRLTPAVPVSVAQGTTLATGSTLSVTSVSADGSPASGRTVAFSTTASGVTLSPTSATTNASGIATTTIYSSNTAAGTINVTVTATDSGRTATYPVTVTQAAGSITLTAPSAIAQGQTATSALAVTTLDRAGAGMRNVAVNLLALDGLNAAPGLYPLYAGCITNSAGACSVDLVADARAKAGSYSIRATSGAFDATRTVAVTSTPADVVLERVTVAQGGSGSAVVSVYDAAGAPVAGRSVTFDNPSPGLSLGGAASATATTNANGQASVVLAAANSAPAGVGSFRATAGAATRTASVVDVTPVVGTIAAAGLATVGQGGQGTLVATVTDRAGAPMSTGVISLSSPVPGLKVEQLASVVNGSARAVVTAATDLAIGDYQVTASGSSATASLTVRVTNFAIGAAVSGAAGQGRSVPVTLTLLSRDGTPMPNTAVSVSSVGGGPALTLAASATDNVGNVQLTVDDTAATGGGPRRAGTFLIDVTSGPTTVSVPVTLAPTAKTITLAAGSAPVTQGGVSSMSFYITDLRDDPAAGILASLGSGSATVGLTTTFVRTGSDGWGSVLLAAGATTGTKTVIVAADGAGTTVTTASPHLSVPVVPAPFAMTVPATPLDVVRTATGSPGSTLSTTVTDFVGSNFVSGSVEFRLRSDAPDGLTLLPSAGDRVARVATSASGEASVNVRATSAVPAGDYTVTGTSGTVTRQFTVRVQ